MSAQTSDRFGSYNDTLSALDERKSSHSNLQRNLQSQINPPLLLKRKLENAQYDGVAAIFAHVDWSALDEKNRNQVQALKLKWLIGQGLFEEALRECSEVLSQELLTSMRLHVLGRRLFCLYELGDFSAVRRDIDAIDQLEKLYPLCIEWVIARTIEVKMMAVEGEPLLARARLDEVSQRLLGAGRINADRLLLLTWAEVEISRQLNEPSLPEAVRAALALSEYLHNIFSINLAKLELLLLADAELQPGLTGQLNLPVAQRWLASYHQQDRELTTPRQWRRAREIGSVSLKSAQVPSTLVFSQLGIVFDVKTGEARSYKRNERTQNILAAVKSGVANKEQLFQVAWQIKKYVAHLHDQVIYVAIGRVRKELLIELRVVEGEIILNGAVII